MTFSPRRHTVKMRGFTLIELLVATLILGLVLGALIVPLSAQFESRRYSEARDDLATIKEALLGFAAARGRLPCPDNNTDGLVPDGLEDINQVAGTCGDGNIHSRRGWLPAATLGVAPTDPWGRYYRYQVATNFHVDAQPGSGCTGTPRVTFCREGNILIQRRGDDPGTVPPDVETRSYVTIATNVAAVVLSTGPNGRGGRAPGLPLIDFDPAASDQDEYHNSSEATTLNAPDFNAILGGAVRGSELTTGCDDSVNESEDAEPLCAFDDVVDWVPATQLMSRLLTAGWLP